MCRRIMLLLLVCVLFAGALSLPAFATPETEATQPAEAEKEKILPLSQWEAAIPVYDLPTHYAQIQRLKHDIPYHHQEAVLASKMEDLGGYCGLFASYQLYYQGINSWLKTHHGNDHFDTYSQMRMTSGGYRPYAYTLEDYTMEQALNAATKYGTFDAYNLLVCFQWTETEDGQKYGHVVYIYAILDGIVYFTESFDTALGTKAGEMIAVTIPQFVNYYADWTTYEGTILFGRPDFMENGFSYEADMFVKAMAPTQLLSQPCSQEAGVLNTVLLRNVAAGERLKVTGLYENVLGEVYYRVDEAGLTGWLPAQKAGPILFLEGDRTWEDVKLPQTITEDMTFSGKVTATKGKVSLQLVDSQKKLITEVALTKKKGAYDLNQKNLAKVIMKEKLTEGWYTWQLVHRTENYYLRDGQVTAEERTTVLHTQSVSVGKPPKQELIPQSRTTPEPKNGWYYENNTWYCYDGGKPRTGWYCTDGVDYYLQTDGSVSTGTVTIAGKERIFTATGALRTGWLETKEGTKYLLSNGVCAYGWLEIDGKTYYFDIFGNKLSKCWITESSQRRYLTKDGSMAVGWLTVDGERCNFSEDGVLLEQDVKPSGLPLRGTGFLPE